LLSVLLGWWEIISSAGNSSRFSTGLSGGEVPISILWPRTPTLPAKVRVVIDEIVRNAHRFADSALIERSAPAQGRRVQRNRQRQAGRVSGVSARFPDRAL